jgi:hypothetical protein
MLDASMRWQSMCGDGENSHTFASCDNLAARPSRLGNKHELGTLGLAFYKFARGETPHLFIADQQVSDRQMRSPTF